MGSGGWSVPSAGVPFTVAERGASASTGAGCRSHSRELVGGPGCSAAAGRHRGRFVDRAGAPGRLIERSPESTAVSARPSSRLPSSAGVNQLRRTLPQAGARVCLRLRREHVGKRFSKGWDARPGHQSVEEDRTHLPIRMPRRESISPSKLRSHSTTATTTTMFKMPLILVSMGM